MGPHWVIRQAIPEELDRVVQLYGEVCDRLATEPALCPWSRDTYPTEQIIRQWLDQKCLYILESGRDLLGAVVLTRSSQPGYTAGNWQCGDGDKVIVLHTLAVRPISWRSGCGKKLMVFAERFARSRRMRAIHLDVCETNAPAIALCESCGYKQVGSCDLQALPPPFDSCRLYELVLT